MTPTTVRLLPGEHAKLIRETEVMANPRRFVSCSFGPGWVAVNLTESPWAGPLIEKWRSGATDQK